MKREAELLTKEKNNLLQVKTEFGYGGGVTTSFEFGGAAPYTVRH